ncbi:UDP-N-acetylglucosamine transferase subunit ALG14-like [Watersipora subatra]|uniref:UDP-N-acetylglucosamine transferase subunit ALG14-like n=1 Tax=Watersipora subatra TaxID=2589382 RepID=UPI00355C3B39
MKMDLFFVILCVTLPLVFLIRLAFLLGTLWNNRRTNTNILSDVSTTSAHLMAVLGSGGHTKELLVFLSVLGPKLSPRSFIVAESDHLSVDKIRQQQKESQDINYEIFKLPRSREIHQSYLSSIFTSIKALMFAVPLVIRVKPDILLVNGPGTCVPVLFTCFLMKYLYISQIKIVYIESICRVTSLSLSGKLAYYLVDSFVVQWPDLTRRYSMASYVGRLL